MPSGKPKKSRAEERRDEEWRRRQQERREKRDHPKIEFFIPPEFQAELKRSAEEAAQSMRGLGDGFKQFRIPSGNPFLTKKPDDHALRSGLSQIVAGDVDVKDGVITWSFDSFGGYLAQAEEGEGWPAIKSSRQVGPPLGSDDPEWSGALTWGDAIQRARYGWPEGLARLNHAFAEARGDVRQVQRSVFEIGREGFCPDIPSYLQGRPDHMLSTAQAARPMRVITIVNSVTVNAGVSADRVVNYGGALISFVQSLTQQGYSVRIVNHWGATAGNELVVHCFCTVKDCGRAIDLDQLAFCLVSPAYFRRLGFSIIEQCRTPEYVDAFQGSYGASNNQVDASYIDGPFLLLTGADGDGMDASTPESAQVAMHDLFAAEKARLEAA